MHILVISVDDYRWLSSEDYSQTTNQATSPRILSKRASNKATTNDQPTPYASGCSGFLIPRNCNLVFADWKREPNKSWKASEETKQCTFWGYMTATCLFLHLIAAQIQVRNPYCRRCHSNTKTSHQFSDSRCLCWADGSSRNTQPIQLVTLQPTSQHYSWQSTLRAYQKFM